VTEWELITGIATIVSTVVGVVSVFVSIWQGKVLSREKPLTKMLLSHIAVRQQYERLRDLALRYSKQGLKREGLLWGMVLINIQFAVLLAIIQLKKGDKGALLFFNIVTVTIIFNALFIFLKRTLISNVRPELNRVKHALNGSAWMFLCSLVIDAFIALIISLSNVSQDIYYTLSTILVAFGVIISSFVFTSIINTGTSLLWKIYVSTGNTLAENLPHLLVKTKTGTFIFGQLYDPLDNNLLILRKARFIDNTFDEQLKRVNSHAVPIEKQERYTSIPWDDIETLQILEKGLYATPNRTSEE